MSGLFKLLTISNEELLLDRKFESLPENFINQIDEYLQKYLLLEEYENCCAVRDYIEFCNKLKQKKNSYVHNSANPGKL
jgi:predicted transcriptional regulator